MLLSVPTQNTQVAFFLAFFRIRNKYMFSFKITKSILEDERGQYTTDMHFMKPPKYELSPPWESQPRLSLRAFRKKNHIYAVFFLQNIHFQKERESARRSSQRSRLDSLSRWFFRSWKTSVKKCGSAFSCSILALILLMMRSDVSQKTSLFASIMKGLSG